MPPGEVSGRTWASHISIYFKNAFPYVVFLLILESENWRNQESWLNIVSLLPWGWSSIKLSNLCIEIILHKCVFGWVCKPRFEWLKGFVFNVLLRKHLPPYLIHLFLCIIGGYFYLSNGLICCFLLLVNPLIIKLPWMITKQINLMSTWIFYFVAPILFFCAQESVCSFADTISFALMQSISL